MEQLEQLEEGFVAANGSNLPRVDILMLGRFISSHTSLFSSLRFRDDELSQASYGQEAVTHVQLKHNGILCTLKCAIQPEDANSRTFAVTLIVNEEKKMITSLQCFGCKNTQWICKHALAFLLWLHRTSEQPTTETCYWSKTRDPIRQGIKRELFNDEDQMQDTARSAIMTQLLHKYDTKHDYDDFLLKAVLTDSLIKKIEEETRGQSQNSLWHDLRMGRITASVAHDIYDDEMEMDTLDMVHTIMGRHDFVNFAMKRGKYLKDEVRDTVCQNLNKEFDKCGLFISKEHTIIAGSPDGICDDSIISIKCPTSKSTTKNYLRYGQPADKYNTQMQILMYVTGRKKCYFCLADWDYEASNRVNIVPVYYDESYAIEVVDALVNFWKRNVYDLLCA